MSTDPRGHNTQLSDGDSCLILSSALGQLRLKLLDLTARNRLINFKHTAGKSLQLVEGQLSDIYNKLVESNGKSAISILGLPDPEKQHWVERNGRLQRPDPKEWAKAVGVPTSYDIPDNIEHDGKTHVRALMYPDDLARHCRKIEREAILAIEETGANMLFLVLGFLEYPDQRDSDKSVISPLISIPVTLLKKEIAGIQAFSLQYTGDDISENLSLREKLRNDFGLTLPDISDDQFDLEDYFDQIQQIIQRQPGFSIKRRVSLCLLSFTNMLLVRDLDPSKWPQRGEKNGLIDHPIVREVFEGAKFECGGALGIAQEHQVEEGPGASIPLVFDADSSQHSALIDALALKKNLVIEGPPGTGKSQTITNLIAACLADGKKVLFVAEKLAALEVVKNRLTQAGLDPFVLELHSNKTNKKRVLEEISKRITYKPDYSNELPKLQRQFESHRNDLKTYADIINSVAHNGFNFTLHQVLWRVEKHREVIEEFEAFLGQISIQDATQISEFELFRRIDCLGHLGSQFEAINGKVNDSSFSGFYPERLIPSDGTHLTNTFKSSLTWAHDFLENAAELERIVGTKIKGISVNAAQALIRILSDLVNNANINLPLHLIPSFFSEDKTGVKAKNILDSLEYRINKFTELSGQVNTLITNESCITKDSVFGLKALDRYASSLNVNLGTLSSMRVLLQGLTESSSKLNDSISTLRFFTKNKSIPFDGSRQKIEQLLNFSNLVVGVPEEYLHLQTSALTREGSVKSIEQLLELQIGWCDLEEKLNEHLYLDNLPPEVSIKQAITTLREGDSWLRIFQGKWRHAVGLHKSLQRSKTKTKSKDRLEQLEQLVEYLSLKEKWKKHPGRRQFLGLPATAELMELEGYLALARWNRDIKLASEDIQAVIIDPIDFTPDQARTLRREFLTLKIDISSAITALDSISQKLPNLHEFAGMHFSEKVHTKTEEFIGLLDQQINFIESISSDEVLYDDIIKTCEASVERSEIKTLIDNDEDAQGLLGDYFQGVETRIIEAKQAFLFSNSFDHLTVPVQIKDLIKSNPLIEICKTIILSLEKVSSSLNFIDTFSSELNRFGDFDISKWTGVDLEENLHEFSKSLINSLNNAVSDSEFLIPWSLYVSRQKEAKELSLTQFVEALENKLIPSDRLVDAYAYCIYNTIIKAAFRNIPQLGRFTGLKHNQIREEFQRLDKEIIKLRGKAIGYDCARGAFPPSGRSGARVDDKSEMVLLHYLLPQKKPRMPVRKMLMRAGGAVQTLKPCFMMGPQAVAQYLTPGAINFDLVIMDEASQLKPEESIGAIARGSQLVVVGDPKQLPPTSFFSKMNQADDGAQFTMTDSESILDVCSSHFQPTRSLRWHYRSRHHSLIAFSNQNFYRGNLIIFPSPYGQGGKLGVRAIYLADAIYENQTNLREAKRVVEAAIDHINNRSHESLGIVTLNIKQRDLIAELLDERLRSSRSTDAFREHWSKEGQPLFIKNLENVQGDERDAIIISTTFGKPPGSGAVRQNFGPISRQGGWRRLNVLFTRAKKSIVLFTSLKPEDIVIDGTTPEGTKVLRNYLEYTRTGNLCVAEETGRDPDSDFEVSVMEKLKLHDFDVTPQLGVAGYRIDLAVKHPDAPGAYLAAIECDGASYHSALSVRDRDRIRQEILESLGWRGRIWRIWSTDWFRAPQQEMEKLLSFLEDLRASWKPEHDAGEAWIEEGSKPSSVKPIRAVSADIPQEMSTEVVDQLEANEINLEREEIIATLIDSDEDLEVEVGDTVHYVDVKKPEDKLTVQIVNGRDSIANGIINTTRPLAQVLLGAVVGDEVTLHLAGTESRNFKILDIIRQMKLF